MKSNSIQSIKSGTWIHQQHQSIYKRRNTSCLIRTFRTWNNRQPYRIWYIRWKTLPYIFRRKGKYLTTNRTLPKNPYLRINNITLKLLNILVKYWSCFDYCGNRTPKCKFKVMHHINTGNSVPFKTKCLLLKPIISAKEKEKRGDLGWRGSIRKSLSPLASPILIVLRMDNDFRIVAD